MFTCNMGDGFEGIGEGEVLQRDIERKI